eukprot:6434123-Amphidinium_carterae.1
MPNQDWRLLASMNGTYYDSLIQQWVTTDVALTPAVYAQAGLAWRQASALFAEEQTPDPKAQAAPAASTEGVDVTILREQLEALKRKLSDGETEPVKKVKLSVVVDQTLDTEIPVLGKTHVHKAFDTYERLMGGPPT